MASVISHVALQPVKVPLVDGVPTNAAQRSIAELQPVELDLGRLEDLQGTLSLLRETGVLP